MLCHSWRAAPQEGSEMAHVPANPGCWPRLMRAEVAAAYVGEKSVEAFRRTVGCLYPAPVKIAGKGERWLREDLDGAIGRLAGRDSQVRDASAVL
jgi:hypothetical protein